MQNFLIIGGSSGIGKATVEELSLNGHQVYSTYNHNQPKLSPENIIYHQLDVTKEIDISWIPEQIDGLVYCPGSINLLPFTRITTQDFKDDFDLQVVGAIQIIQAVLPALKKSPQASIVLFSTIAVKSGFNFHTQVAVSKGAIEGLVTSLAAELAPDIRVNAIAPSLTDTPLASNLLNTEQKRIANANRVPLKRLGNPQDIAQMVTFLLSEKASWITGQIIHIDGGLSSIRL